MEGGSSRKELPAGIKIGGKRQKLTAVNVVKQYLDSLKEIGKRMEKTSSDSDRMFLLSLLPAMKQLLPLDNLDFWVEVQETLRRKLRHLAAREVQLITYPSTPSASLALSEYSGNSHINLTDYISASYATDPVTLFNRQDHQCKTHCTSYKKCRSKKHRKVILSCFVFVLCYYFRNKNTILVILH
jgi:hypothetical protein